MEANGFITLANNFVTYAALLVTALNSMASRFITIEYVNGSFKRANCYYNSVFWGNIIIVAFLIVPSILFVFYMERIIHIPNEIIIDTKVLFSFVFFNFFLTTALPNWECGVYITNRLDRIYVPNIIIGVLRCVLLLVAFSCFKPKVWLIGFVASISTIATLAVNYINTHKLTPELHIGLKKDGIIYSKKAVKQLVGSGIWNSVSSTGYIFLEDMDILISNIFFGAEAMGVVSLSKILPGIVQKLSVSVREAFAPELTINFANNDKEKLLKDIKRAMKLTSIILTVPVAGIIIMGDKFYKLWVPSQDAVLLQCLSIIAVIGYAFTSGTQILYNVFTTVNKVKQNSIAMIISGFFSIVLSVIITRKTHMGLYAVVGVSEVCNFIRNMCFTLPATSKYIGLKWHQFYPQVAVTLFSTGIISIIGLFLKKILLFDNWGFFFVSAFITGAIGLTINLFIFLSKEERAYFIKLLCFLKKQSY